MPPKTDEMNDDNREETARRGNALWRAAEEHPESYEAARDFASFLIENLHPSYAFLDSAQLYIAKTLSFGRNGPETPVFLPPLADIFSERGDPAKDADNLDALGLSRIHTDDMDLLRVRGFALNNAGGAGERIWLPMQKRAKPLLAS